MSLTINDDQIKRLEASILEIPGKYAIPILQLINGFIQENTPAKTKPELVDQEENPISELKGP